MAIEEWVRLARAPGSSAYWVFRGSFQVPHPDGTTDVQNVVWADREVMLSTRIQGRMATPGRIVHGLPETVGGAPERVSTEITLDDLDEALVPYFVGGASPETEYMGFSVLNLRGRLFYGLQGADGTTTEVAVTPTLVTAGAPTRKGRRITIPMASWDEKFFGAVRDLFTVGSLAEAEVVQEGTTYFQLGTEPFTATQFGEIVSEWTENLEQIVPWAYGRPTLLPIKATGELPDRLTWAGFVSRKRPDLSSWGAWSKFLGEVGAHVPASWYVSAHAIKVRVQNIHGEDTVVWAVLVSWDWTKQVPGGTGGNASTNRQCRGVL